MSGFTKPLRERIVREFATRHNGVFNPSLFLNEVRSTGTAHPAHAWFEWDTDKAALAFQIEQARAFARDIRITFKVEEVIGPHSVRVREAPMPMVLSPVDNRSKGGGYVLVDPDDPAHIVEHCRQAAMALRQWQRRYEAAIAHVGVDQRKIEGMLSLLDSASATDKVA